MESLDAICESDSLLRSPLGFPPEPSLIEPIRQPISDHPLASALRLFADRLEEEIARDPRRLREHPLSKVEAENPILFRQLSQAAFHPSDQRSVIMLERVIEVKPLFACKLCGFRGKEMHWQCPGCKSWNTVKPISSIEGE